MATLHAHLFGKFVSQWGDLPPHTFHSFKVQELFCYLLLNRDRSLAREVVASLIWTNVPTQQSKKNLRHALWQLRSVLSAHGDSSAKKILDAGLDSVTLHSSCLKLDVQTFEHACELAHGVRSPMDRPTARIVQHAVELYKADLLEGWFQDWCLYKREQLQNEYLYLLDKLMIYCEAQREFDAGFEYGSRILRYDRSRELAYQRLMRLRYLAGDRIGALREFKRCVDALREDLDVPPSARTLALHEQIRADRLDADLPPKAHSLPPLTSHGDSASNLLGRLKQMRTFLDNLQRQVRQEIKVVERALESRR